MHIVDFYYCYSIKISTQGKALSLLKTLKSLIYKRTERLSLGICTNKNPCTLLLLSLLLKERSCLLKILLSTVAKPINMPCFIGKFHIRPMVNILLFHLFLIPIWPSSNTHSKEYPLSFLSQKKVKS